MRAPQVHFRLPDGQQVTVVPGGFIGRTSGASLRIADPRVSEAHALVSLRGREIRLLSLRGRLTVDGEDQDEVVLAAGQRVSLGGAVVLEVVGVEVPDEVLALEIAGEVRELCAAAYSLVARPVPDLVPRLIPDAPATVWSADDGWQIRVGAGPAQPIRPGKSWDVDGVPVRARAVPVSAITSDATQRLGALSIVCRTTTAHVHRPHREPLTVDARAGRLLSEIALMGAPVDWLVAAEILWPGERDPRRLRKGFDAVLARLRSRLREGGVREDLVRMDGKRNIELFLHAGDVVIDEA